MEILEGVFNEEDEMGNKIRRSSAGKTTTSPYQCQRHSSIKRHDEWLTAHSGTSCTDDPLLCMVEHIFGYPTDGQITGKNGINEFLSAVVAVRQLEGHLTKDQLAQIVCCIEATIPFKNSNDAHPDNTAHMERLFANMVDSKENCNLSLTDEQLIESVQLAAFLANEDIGNFGTEDRYWFLDNTWSLLPETNTSLRQQFLYTIMEYQKVRKSTRYGLLSRSTFRLVWRLTHEGRFTQAVFNMHGFFGFLQPRVIFATFRGVPSQEHIAKMTAEAGNNLGKLRASGFLLSAYYFIIQSILTLMILDLPKKTWGKSMSGQSY